METIREQIKAELLRLIQKELKVEESAITEETNLRDGLQMDSLSAIDIFMGIEEKFGVDFSYDEIEKLKTVKDVVDFFEAVVNKKNKAANS